MNSVLTSWLPCPYALSLVMLAGIAGYVLGRWREQLRLLETFKPER